MHNSRRAPSQKFSAFPLLCLTDEDRQRADAARALYQRSLGSSFRMGAVPPGDLEEKRLATLRVLDMSHAREPFFTSLVKLACDVSGYPMCFISIIEEVNAWVKADHCFPVPSTPREAAFCSYLIACSEPIVVLDASQDPRFKDHPGVTGPPGLRFYAGFPLIVNKCVVGSLCFLDLVPHDELPSSTALVMSRIATMVEAVLEERLSRRLLEARHSFLGQTLLRNVPPGMAERWMASLCPGVSAPPYTDVSLTPTRVIDPFFFASPNLAVVVITYSRVKDGPISLALIAKLHTLIDACAGATNVTLATTSEGIALGASPVIYNSRREVGLQGDTGGPVAVRAPSTLTDFEEGVRAALGFAVLFIREAAAAILSQAETVQVRAAVTCGSLHVGVTSGARVTMFGRPVHEAYALVDRAADRQVGLSPLVRSVVSKLLPNVDLHEGDAVSGSKPQFLNATTIRGFPSARVIDSVTRVMSITPLLRSADTASETSEDDPNLGVSPL